MVERILKLEASAGSGKTFLLTLEYITRLLQILPASPRTSRTSPEALWQGLGSILAVTFTNKAAGEMKERILSTLKSFAAAGRGAGRGAGREAGLSESSAQLLGLLSQESGIAQEAILGQADRLVEAILSGYDDFHVQTIDSLMSQIVTVISPDLDLPADFEIAVDSGESLGQACIEYLASLASNDWPRLESFLDEYASLFPLNKWSLQDEIIEAVQHLHSLSLHRQQAGWGRDLNMALHQKERWEQSRRALHDRLANLFALIAEEPHRNRRCAHLNGNQFTEKRLASLESFTLRGDDRAFPLLAFLGTENPSPLLVKGCPCEYRERFSSSLEAVRAKLAPAFEDFSRFRISRFLDFYHGFEKHWITDRDILFVEEFSRVLHERICQWESYAYPYLYLKLSDRYLHFLFDEFQDTSELQFSALAPIVDEVLSSQKNATLFIVGDRKQAIYRWRGGNPRLMDEEALKNEIPSLAHLPSAVFSRAQKENWRSAAPIVDFLNSFWKPEAIATTMDGDVLAEAASRNFADAVQVIPGSAHTGQGHVCIDLWRARRTDPENEEEDEEDATDPKPAVFAAVRRHIKTCLASGFMPSDIGVLMRKNEDCRTLLSDLGKAGIDAASDESLLLDSNPLAAEIVAFFRFLDYPPDNLSFATFIQGSLFRKQAHALHPEEQAGEAAIIGAKKGSALYRSFRERYPRTWSDLIGPFFQAAGFLAPYDLFADFLMRFRAFEHFPDNQAFFSSFADLLHRLEHDHIHSLAAFLERWPTLQSDSRVAAVESSLPPSAVRLMTIHQAKGLGFPVVIVALLPSPDQHDKPIFPDGDELYWITSDYRKGSSALRAIAERHLVLETIDQLNVLYVATTRAKEALFVTGAAPRRPKNRKPDEARPFTSLAEVFFRHPLFDGQAEGRIQYLAGTLPKKKPPQSTPQATAEPPSSKKLATIQWQREYLVFRPGEMASDESRAATRRGDALHRLLARIPAGLSPIGLKESVARLGREEKLAEEDIHLLGDFLARPEVHLFFAQQPGSFTEKETCRLHEGIALTQRIDRLVVGQEIWVVEFKTGKERPGEHAEQVKGYMRSIAPLFPQQTIVGYLLYLDLGSVEEVRC